MNILDEDIEVVAGVIVYNPLINRFLVLKSKWGYDLPKGHAEPGESVKETAVRECYEETGLRPNLVPNFHCGVQEDQKRYFFFLGTVTTTEIKISKEHDQSYWVDGNFGPNLKYPLSEIFKATVAMLEVEDLFVNN